MFKKIKSFFSKKPERNLLPGFPNFSDPNYTVLEYDNGDVETLCKRSGTSTTVNKITGQTSSAKAGEKKEKEKINWLWIGVQFALGIGAFFLLRHIFTSLISSLPPLVILLPLLAFFPQIAIFAAIGGIAIKIFALVGVAGLTVVKAIKSVPFFVGLLVPAVIWVLLALNGNGTPEQQGAPQGGIAFEGNVVLAFTNEHTAQRWENDILVETYSVRLDNCHIHNDLFHGAFGDGERFWIGFSPTQIFVNRFNPRGELVAINEFPFERFGSVGNKIYFEHNEVVFYFDGSTHHTVGPGLLRLDGNNKLVFHHGEDFGEVTPLN